jgi:HlyD family secretion protein
VWRSICTLPDQERVMTALTAVEKSVSVGGKPRAGRSYRRWIVAGACVVLAITVGIYLRSGSSVKANYVTATVDRGNIESTVTTTGNLNAVITVQVGSQVSGNIIALYADFNTKVKKGQLVAEIDPAPFKAAVDQAAASLNAAKAAVVTAQATLAKSKADLASAEANVVSQKANVVKAVSAVDLAKVENDRRQVMVKTGSTSQEDADTAKANYDQAVAGVDAANASVNAAESAAESARKGVDVAQTQLDQAKAVVAQDQAVLAQAQLNLEHTRILAPVDGTVESRNMDVGQTVAASFQAPVIFLIAQDLTKMQVDTNVDESDVGRVKVDQAATFTVDAWPGRVFRGRVAQIREAPINVSNVITYDVVVQVSNEDLKLFPGMTANVTIAVGRADNVLRLPKAALRFHPRSAAGAKTGTAQNVAVLDARGQLKQIAVKTGLSDANYVEVVSGDLHEGDHVVIGMAGQTAAAQTPRPGGRMGF